MFFVEFLGRRRFSECDVCDDDDNTKALSRSPPGSRWILLLQNESPASGFYFFPGYFKRKYYFGQVQGRGVARESFD